MEEKKVGEKEGVRKGGREGEKEERKTEREAEKKAGRKPTYLRIFRSNSCLFIFKLPMGLK